MVEHVYRRALAASSVQAAIVATDDARIRDAVTAFGGEVRMTAADHRSGTDRLAEAARDLHCDVVVNLQADEPLVDPAAIDLAVQALGDADTPMSTARCPIASAAELDDPDIVKVVIDAHGFALYFSRAAVPHRERAGAGVPAGAWRHVGLYAYRRPFLFRFAALETTPLERAERLEQLRAIEHGYRIRTVEITGDSVGVDTPRDLDRVRRLVSGGIS